jgi:hypothetical protein
MQHRRSEGQGRLIPVAGVRAGSEWQRASTTATNIGLRSARRAHRHGYWLGWAGGASIASTASTNTCDGRGQEALVTRASERRTAAARWSGIRVRDGMDGDAAARRCGGGGSGRDKKDW